MPEIELRENKILKLTNILSRKVPPKELFSQDKQIVMMQNWIKAKGYEAFGPLIIYSSGVKGIDADNRPIVDSYIMVQLKTNNVRIEIPYNFEKEIRIENCLFARFSGNAEKLQFATSKLILFAYENDFELSGETYIIFIEQKEKLLLADVFMPVKRENSEIMGT